MDFVRITPAPNLIHHSSRPDRSRTAPISRPGSLSGRLNAEWFALTTDPAVAAELDAEPIAGHADLSALLADCGGDRSLDRDEADATLAQVVAAGLEGRTLAVRVTLQRVLGALVAISVRRRSDRDSRVVLFDDLCSNAWLVISGYPLARRPRRIAANISRDTEYVTCVRPSRLHDVARRTSLEEEHIPLVGLAGTRQVTGADELSDLLLGLHGSADLSDSELALLRALAAGTTTATIAERLQCTDRTVRNMRRRLLVKLRELSAA
jgi:DNA-binding CsgD family transcriptional regulator